jgi:hypothetical protein
MTGCWCACPPTVLSLDTNEIQPTSPMAWTVVNSGPYIEQPSGNRKRSKWKTAPTCSPSRSLRVRFHTSTLTNLQRMSTGLPESGRVKWHTLDVAAAFTAVTGKPAKFQAIPVEIWHTEAWTGLPKDKDTKIGFNSVKDDSHLQLTFEQNFTNWWNLCRASGGNKASLRGIMRCWIGSCRAE